MQISLGQARAMFPQTPEESGVGSRYLCLAARQAKDLAQCTSPSAATCGIRMVRD
jgi:hypothetical protein